jgi:acyl-CoA thioester hydrolase
VNSHTEKMRVNWIDTDGSGTIHYTAALRYFEVAEHQLMRKLFGGGVWFAERDFGFPRVHVECDYKAPLRFSDEFECTARVIAVGRRSVTYGYEARRSDGVLCLVGKIVAVVLDKDGKSMDLPKEFREVLERAIAGHM